MAADEETVVIIAELATVVRDFRLGAEAYKSIAEGRTNVHQTATFSGGSFGIWVAVTCCLVMVATLAVAVPIAVGAYLDQKAEIRKLENTDNAIRAYINTGRMPPQPEKK